MNDYEALFAEKEALTKRLAEIDKEIKEQERIIYRGKMQKAIDLLKECSPALSNFLIFYFYRNCKECEEKINIKLYLEDVIKELENTMNNCL